MAVSWLLPLTKRIIAYCKTNINEKITKKSQTAVVYRKFLPCIGIFVVISAENELFNKSILLL